MKESRYSDSQIMTILKQAEAGVPVHELCREHGMSSAVYSGEVSHPLRFKVATCYGCYPTTDSDDTSSLASKHFVSFSNQFHP